MRRPQRGHLIRSHGIASALCGNALEPLRVRGTIAAVRLAEGDRCSGHAKKRDALDAVAVHQRRSCRVQKTMELMGGNSWERLQLRTASFAIRLVAGDWCGDRDTRAALDSPQGRSFGAQIWRLQTTRQSRHRSAITQRVQRPLAGRAVLVAGSRLW